MRRVFVEAAGSPPSLFAGVGCVHVMAMRVQLIAPGLGGLASGVGLLAQPRHGLSVFSDLRGLPSPGVVQRAHQASAGSPAG